MAEIPIEKKSSNAWVWIVLLLLLGALLLWWLLSDDGEQIAVEDDVVTTELVEEDTMMAGDLTLAAIAAAPLAHVGLTFSGDVDVTEVPTDRGFWVEHEGARMFALINDGPQEVPMDINAGQDLQISAATVRNASDLTGIPGDPIDDDTRAILAEQEAYLLINEDDMQIIS